MRLQTVPSLARSPRHPGWKANVPARGPTSQQPTPPTPPPWHQIRFVFFFHTTFMFFSHWNSLNILFSEKREFFFQTCFSNLDTLQSTSNEAPILEIDPCIYEPFKSKFFPIMYWCTRAYKHKDSQSSSFFHLSNKGRGQWALTFISFGLLYLKRQSPLYSMHRRYPIREVVGFQYH